MANKVGPMIKEARTAAGMTQEQLARRLAGISANDISKFERGEAIPTQAVLKEIAKLTGVTQASLLNAAKESTAKTAGAKTTASKAATSKTTTSKSTASRSTAAKKTTAAPASANTSMKVTATEKKLIELYRAADSDTKKAATRVLKGECSSMLSSLLGSGSNGVGDAVADFISDALGSLLGGGK